MNSNFDFAGVRELIRALDEFAFQFPSLHPDDYTEWDTQEWYDEEIERYAEVVGEVVERIDRGEMKASDLYRTETRERGKAAGNWHEDMVVVADDDDRSWGPKRYAPREQRQYPGECLNRPRGWGSQE